MIDFVLHIIFLLALFFGPLIIIALFAVVIMGIVEIIKAKTISVAFKIIIIVIIILLIFLIIISIYSEEPDNMYMKMRMLNTDKSLIGLSEEEVVEKVGVPAKNYKDRNSNKIVYKYEAGTIIRKVEIFGSTFYKTTDPYVLKIIFDEADKVESTSIKYSEEFVEP